MGGWILWVFEGTHGLGHSDAWFAEGNGDATKVSQGSFWQVIIDSALGIAMLKISIALNLLRLSPARWYVYCLWTSIGKFNKIHNSKQNISFRKLLFYLHLVLTVLTINYTFSDCRGLLFHGSHGLFSLLSAYVGILDSLFGLSMLSNTAFCYIWTREHWYTSL